MTATAFHHISGKENGVRLESRVLEERIQQALADGHRRMSIHAYGQHGIGGRLWQAGDTPVYLKIEGHSGQRTGSLGYPNTTVELMGPASDDIGWLNAGATIVVHGHAGNGAVNGMAQGTVYVGGNIGARGMTMTKHNPRFDPPQLWVMGSAGDYFGEFMAGGIAVICGIEPQTPDNILGYRPLVGMVGGKVFVRGPIGQYSRADACLTPIGDRDWQWLQQNFTPFLKAIDRMDLMDELNQVECWQLLTARTPQEKIDLTKTGMADFRRRVWDAELGQGGLIGDLTTIDRSPIGLIATGEMRRFVPLWQNHQYLAPCEASCPTGIPIQRRWRLIRDGRIDEAVDLALAYTPFPATVCGYLCPNPCMQACTRGNSLMTPVDVAQLGKASRDADLPDLPPLGDAAIAVVGGGPAGISVAWHLRRLGHNPTIFDTAERLGGKIAAVIPNSRIPADVVEAEIARIAAVLPHVRLQQQLTGSDMMQLREDYDFTIIATGAQKPRTLNVPGAERLVSALDFLRIAKTEPLKYQSKIQQVVIIGAGNVGCDVAAEAHRLGAAQITLIDVQPPAAFGAEKKAAQTIGADFRWPCFTESISEDGVKLTSGELLEADTVIVSIGDAPDLSFVPESIARERGFIRVDAHYRTSDPKTFAIGDTVRPGLITDAIGAGKTVSTAIDAIIKNVTPPEMRREMIDRDRISLEYFDPRLRGADDLGQCGQQCASCGDCRDCGICINICPQQAISRQQLTDDYEYVVDSDRCIGCGFCAGACPCGIWNLVENLPL